MSALIHAFLVEIHRAWMGWPFVSALVVAVALTAALVALFAHIMPTVPLSECADLCAPYAPSPSIGECFCDLTRVAP